MTIAGQIAFPAVANPSSNVNTLDDYEEGTWTPSIGGTASYSVQTGNYVKIGKVVYIQGELTINALGTGSVNTISGLPFTSAAAAGNSCCIPISSSTALAVLPVSIAFTNANNTTTLVAVGRTAGAASATTQNIFGNSAAVTFTGFYFT